MWTLNSTQKHWCQRQKTGFCKNSLPAFFRGLAWNSPQGLGFRVKLKIKNEITEINCGLFGPGRCCSPSRRCCRRWISATHPENPHHVPSAGFTQTTGWCLSSPWTCSRFARFELEVMWVRMRYGTEKRLFPRRAVPHTSPACSKWRTLANGNDIYFCELQKRPRWCLGPFIAIIQVGFSMCKRIERFLIFLFFILFFLLQP